MVVGKLLELNNLPSVKDARNSGVNVKTVQINAAGANPKESMSFPAIDFSAMAKQSWRTSDLYRYLSGIFVIAVFRDNPKGVQELCCVFSWEPSTPDLRKAEAAWKKAHTKILTGNGDFPKQKDGSLLHLRPHGQNAADTQTTPAGETHTRQSFWLNRVDVGRIVSENC